MDWKHCLCQTPPDQLFGLLAQAMRTVDCLSDADDIVRTIRRLMEKLHIQHWVGADCEVHVEKLNDVRDWNAWFRLMGVDFEGGLLSDATGVHGFLFMRRKGHARPSCGQGGGSSPRQLVPWERGCTILRRSSTWPARPSCGCWSRCCWAAPASFRRGLRCQEVGR